MTVNHWVPGSSPGRGAKFKASVHTGAFLWPWDSHLGLRPRLFGPRASPLRGRAEARSAAQSSPGRGAKFKASVHTGAFLWPWDSHLGLRPRLFGPRASPLRGRAEARSAAQSSPGRGAKFKASVHTGAFLWPWDSHLGLRPRLFGPRASPLRGRAEARSAAQSSPGRGAKSESLGSYRGFFVAVGLLTKATPHAH